EAEVHRRDSRRRQEIAGQRRDESAERIARHAKRIRRAVCKASTGVSVRDACCGFRKEARRREQLKLPAEKARGIGTSVRICSRNAGAEQHGQERDAVSRRLSASVPEVTCFARRVVEQRPESGIRKTALRDEGETECIVASVVTSECRGIEVRRR